VLMAVALTPSAVSARVVSVLMAVAFVASAASARAVSVAIFAVVANVPADDGSVNVKFPSCAKTVLNTPVVVMLGIESNAVPMETNSARMIADKPSAPVAGLPLGV
jgi:hypothetical protein